MAESRQSGPGGMIIRQKEPVNLETPLDQVDSYLTPTALSQAGRTIHPARTRRRRGRQRPA